MYSVLPDRLPHCCDASGHGFEAALRAFAEKKVSLLRADWTQRDPEITTALRSIGRSGVPAYVLLLPGHPPVVLGEMPSEVDIRRALSGI
ncbi:hypothetical protein [Acidovorax delafieldii]|uniref:hypothetical protein n=1 Tax=Acidovorax delafieldii TaxID=47920 RepID=UPI0002EC0942|nr:hypothetical protein [Acidovorax delafieldii]